MCINAILVASLSVANGFTGVFSLGHVGFVAIGAYASGILSLPLKAKAVLSCRTCPTGSPRCSLSFLPATVVAGLICVAVAFVVGAPLMRLSGHFVSVATLGFLIIVNIVLINAIDFTRGARTFTGVPLRDDARLGGRLAGAHARRARPHRLFAGGPALPRGARGHDRRAGDRHLGAAARGSPPTCSAPSSPASAARSTATISARSRRRSFYMAYTFALISMLVIGGMQSLTGAVLGVVVVTLLQRSAAQPRARARFRRTFASRRSTVRARSSSASSSSWS